MTGFDCVVIDLKKDWLREVLALGCVVLVIFFPFLTMVEAAGVVVLSNFCLFRGPKPSNAFLEKVLMNKIQKFIINIRCLTGQP